MMSKIAKRPRSDFKKTRKHCESRKEMFPESLYNRLDVTPQASSEEIKKQCGIIGSKKQTNEERQVYAEIANILTDPERRVAYDLTKTTDLHLVSGLPGATHHAQGMHQTMRKLVGDAPLARMREIWSAKPKAKDVTHSLKCTLEDFYNGKNVRLKIQRNQMCPICQGCRYITATQVCQQCQGRGTVRTPNELQFKLPPGCRNGFRKRLKGQGDSPAHQIPSDIYLLCEQKKHPIYTRVGSELMATVTLTFNEHISGCYKYIKHLKETSKPEEKAKTYKMLKVNIPPLKRKLVIPNKGLPVYNTENVFGHLIINIIIDYPEILTEALVNKLENLLPEDMEISMGTDDLNQTMEVLTIEPFEKIGFDKVDNTRDDQDQVSDGIEKCPIS